MAMNRVQFQKGFSLPKFNQRFGTEEQCAAALETARLTASDPPPAGRV